MDADDPTQPITPDAANPQEIGFLPAQSAGLAACWAETPAFTPGF